MIRLAARVSKDLARGLKSGSAVTIEGVIQSIERKDRRGDWQHRVILVRVTNAGLVAR